MSSVKFLFLFLFSISLVNCASLYNRPLQNVIKVAEYEDGDRSSGIVYMYFTYDARTEKPTLNLQESEDNASQICKNWGFTGATMKDPGQILSKCINMDFYNGKCRLYKAPLKAVCYK